MNYEQKTMNYANNKQTQFLQRPKMSVNLYILKDYENETAFRPKKTNPIQTQSPKGQNRLPKNPATPGSASLHHFVLQMRRIGQNTEGLHTDNYAKNKVNSIVFAL